METEYNNQRGDYHTKDHRAVAKSHVILTPEWKASPDYPNWRCKNACGFTCKEDYEGCRCPKCLTPLVRWVLYEEKGKG